VRRAKCVRQKAEGEEKQRSGRIDGAVCRGAASCAAPTGNGTMTGTRTPGSGGGGGGSLSGPLVALYVATAGLQGNALGSDEEEITLLVYILIDELQNKVI